MKRLGYQERNTLVHSYDYKTFYSENSYIAFGDTMGYIAGLDSIYTLTRGRKKYEASNHLGNVMVVFTDKRINQCINDSVRYYRADLRSAYDYYPFGMLIPDRTFDSTAYIQLPDRVDTTISQRIKIQIPSLNPGQNIILTKDGETYVLAQYQSGYTGAQYSATIAGSAIVNELSFEDSSGYLIIENTTLGGQKTCSGIPSFSLNIAGTNYVVNCSQSIDTIQGGLLSEAGYLFGFNTQERDDEIYGKGNLYSAEFWHFDSRLGRRWNVDPFVKYWESPYACFYNNPIVFIDLKGLTGTSSVSQATVQKGDGPERFSKRNGIKIEDLVKWNKDVFPEGLKEGTYMIHPGQILNVSDPEKSSEYPKGEGNQQKEEGLVINSEILSLTGDIIGFVSIPVGAIESFGGGLLDAKKLLEEGRFLATWNGETKNWSLLFIANQTVPKSYVSEAKSAFIMKALVNSKIYEIVECTGKISNLAGGLVSYIQFKNGDIGPVEFTFDLAFTYIGAWGGTYGFVASSVYFVAKIVFKGDLGGMKSEYGGYDLSNQSIMRSPFFVPK